MSSDFDCSVCNGSGYIWSKTICTSCSGKSKILCRHCYDGIMSCKVCNGSGRKGIFGLFSCPKCMGHGVLTCPICNGTGKIDCPKCGGRGAINQNITCKACSGSGRDYSEVRNWSIERIRFELDVLEKDNQHCYAELRDLEGSDCSDGRGYPVGIDYNYNKIARNDKTIQVLRNIMRNRI